MVTRSDYGRLFTPSAPVAMLFPASRAAQCAWAQQPWDGENPAVLRAQRLGCAEDKLWNNVLRREREGS